MAVLEKHDAGRLERTVPRGFVDARQAAENLRIVRLPPAAGLEAMFDNHYLIEWDLPPDRSIMNRLLPSPNANLLIDDKEARIAGVVTGLRIDRVAGSGWIFGSRFCVGALRPYLTRAMARLNDKYVSASTVLGEREHCATQQIRRGADSIRMVLALRDILAERLLPAGEPARQAQAIVALMKTPDGPTSVEHVGRTVGMTPRSIQRLFLDYVGVSPKWVIRRYRLQDIASRLARSERISLSDLAAEYGYFDQAHLTRDFTGLFGMSPTQFRKAQVGSQ